MVRKLPVPPKNEKLLKPFSGPSHGPDKLNVNFLSPELLAETF
jgi:hypothetical protein